MATQRIRVSFFDPDATDSDSGDDSTHVPRRKAAVKREMVILVTASATNRSRTDVSTITGSTSGPPPPPPMRRMRGGAKAARSTPNRRFRGVYERQPGRWAADFRSHRLNVRRWLGTFATEEDAKAAYDAFASQFSLGAASAESPTATRSIVLDGSEQSETGTLNRQADDLSTVSSAAPCMSSLTSSPPPPPPPPDAIVSHKPLPGADERELEDPFLAELHADGGSIGLADLADLPLPSLDDKLDFGSGDWSMLNTIGFR